MAFTGDSSVGRVTTPWEMQNGVQRRMCWEVSGSGADGGRGGFISLRTKESTQRAMGQTEQLKGWKKRKGASLAGSAFFFKF